MMDQLMLPGRVPQGGTLRDKEMLASIFGALPEGTMLKALEAVGVQVKDPQSHLAPDDGENEIPSWNQRRISLKGQDARPPVWDKSMVVDVPVAPPQGRTPPYLSPDYDAGIEDYALGANAQGGF